MTFKGIVFPKYHTIKREELNNFYKSLCYGRKEYGDEILFKQMVRKM